jgi:hypothetical protein
MAAKQKKVTVTFTQDVKVLDHNGEVEQEYKAGQVIALIETSANRWIKRGMAAPGKTEQPPAPAGADNAPDNGGSDDTVDGNATS